jgi:membrane protein required for colicin V production
MWLNLLALAVLAIYVALGAWRGALTTGLGIATLLLAYAAAIGLGPPLAPAVEARLGVGSPFSLAIGGSVAFFGTYAIAGIAAAFVRRMGRRQNEGRAPLDRFLGGAFGALRGLLVALLLVYLASWLDALRATGTAQVIPELGDSAAATLAGDVMESAISAALDPDDPAARVTARIAERPALAAVELQSVVEDPNFANLRGDSTFWSHVESGDVDAAMNRRAFQRLQHDAQLRHKLANLALVSDEAAGDPVAFREAAGAVLREVGPRIRGLRNDPELQALMRDPEVAAMIQNGNTLGLLAHPGFRELVARVTSGTAPD